MEYVSWLRLSHSHKGSSRGAEKWSTWLLSICDKAPGANNVISSSFRLCCQLLRKTSRKEGLRARQQLLSQNDGIGRLRGEAVKARFLLLQC